MSEVLESRIEISALSKDFGYQQVLRDINLTIEQGEFVVLMGTNGAGKTTLLRAMAGLSVPTSGTIHVAQIDMRRAGPGLRRRIGFVSHDSLLYPELTSRENLAFHSHLFGVVDFDTALNSLTQTLGLTNIIDKSAGLLSHGNRQRVALARALIHGPSVLLLDEPFSGLDEQSATNLIDILRELTRSGRTVIMTTHDRSLIESGPTRLIELDNGVVVEDRKLNGHSSHASTSKVAVVSPTLALPPKILRSAVAITKKDLLIEARTKDLLGSSGLFALCVLITTSFTTPPGEAVSGMATGVLWVSILFATMLAVGRSMSRESSNRGIEALILAPIPRESVFIGKVLGNLAIMTMVTLLSVILFLVVLAPQATSFNPVWLAMVTVLGTFGLVIVTTLFSGIALGTRLGESMLALIVMPVAIPLMIGCVELTRMALGAQSTGFTPWSVLLLSYDVMLGIVALATFTYVIEE